MDDASRRLAQLARVLSDARLHGDESAPDPAEHLHRVHLQRIPRLTVQLDDRVGRDVDGIDAVAMRLLLDEYAAVIDHLRSAVRAHAQTLEGLAATLRTDRRRVHQQLERREQRFASTAPSERQRPSRNPDT